ncbi:MAG TPA: hypothetical protein VGD26_07090, partial [Chitinophagaceae bacterium]
MRLRLFYIFLVSCCLSAQYQAHSQASPLQQQWGPNDTIIVSIINYQGEMIPYKELDVVYVSNLPPDKMAKAIAAYN